MTLADMRWTAAPAAILIFTAALSGIARADANPAVTVSHAWTPAQAEVGVDTPVYMTIANGAGEADALVRAKCPAATFTEFRVIDRGEGVPSPRLVKSIPIPPGPTSLDPDGPRIVLLQTTEALPAGTRFTCTLTFRNAGAVEAAIQAGAPAAAH